ncbi:MAG: HK97 family phage prohead protease [Chitinispirillia bacterium]|nr:HK97 family phage prohead protease [Chitinispirillia bacterium]
MNIKKTVSKNRIEMRVFEVPDIELRASENDDKQEYVDGTGAVYDREVEVWPGVFEKIRKGAFNRCLKKGGELKSFFNHNSDYVLSTTRSAPPLNIEDTDKALVFRSPIPNTSYGRDLIENLRRRNVRGASFSFIVAEGGAIYTRDERGIIHREIIDADIFELGPVTNPAYPQTKVKVRSKDEIMEEALEALGELEECSTSTDTSEEEQKSLIQTNKNLLELKRKKLNILERM